MEDTQLPPQRKQEGLRNLRDWRFLAVVITAILLPIALMAIVLTAPISEMQITVSNVDETDVVYVQIYLDGSRAADSHYLGTIGSVRWVFHVAPGTHTVRIDFVYFNNSGHLDYLWTARVEFNGILYRYLSVDSEEVDAYPYPSWDISPNERIYVRTSKPPLKQAIDDQYFMLSIITLSALHVLLVAAVWNYRRATTKVPEKRP